MLFHLPVNGHAYRSIDFMRQMLCCPSLTQTTAFFTATKRVCGVELKMYEILVTVIIATMH
jgi:hypothetical protein